MDQQTQKIWSEDGELIPLVRAPETSRRADVAVIIVSRDRPDLVESLVEQLRPMGAGLDKDIYVVEMGTKPELVSPHSSLRYEDREFRGKCYGHNVGLRLARSRGSYRYYWILMNDLVFDEGVDVISRMVEIMEANPRLAVLSPTERDSNYYGSLPEGSGDYHPVSTCDYLALFMRAEVVEEVGFLNPEFKYCWGAIHELAYQLYRAGWQVGYCDRVQMKHLGGTTYGKVKSTISREEYQVKARQFAAAYFREHYGEDWDREFTRVLPPEVVYNTFTIHRSLWEGAAPTPAGSAGPPSPWMRARQILLHHPRLRPWWFRLGPFSRWWQRNKLSRLRGAGPLKLHLGCGAESLPGYINIDVNPLSRADLILEATDLWPFADRSVDLVEAYHLFEHLELGRARKALREWFRVIKPGGSLVLELPDLDVCVANLGRHFDPAGIDLAMVGIYGFPPDVDKQGMAQVHKWGWTLDTLQGELVAAGFSLVEREPVRQTWRRAAAFGRDMRVRAVVPKPGERVS